MISEFVKMCELYKNTKHIIVVDEKLRTFGVYKPSVQRVNYLILFISYTASDHFYTPQNFIVQHRKYITQEFIDYLKKTLVTIL